MLCYSGGGPPPTDPAGRAPDRAGQQKPRAHLSRPGAVLHCTYMYCTVLCCTVLYQVPNTELVRDLRWLDPRGEEVTQDTRSAAALVYSVHCDQCNHVSVSL